MRAAIQTDRQTGRAYPEDTVETYSEVKIDKNGTTCDIYIGGE